MATITTEEFVRLVVYTVGPTPSTGPFDIPFPFLDPDTVTVYDNGTEIFDYIVTQGSPYGTTGNFVTLDVAVSDTRISVFSDTGVFRSTGDTFVGAELSQEIDRIYAILQEQDQRGFFSSADGITVDAMGLRLVNLADPVDDQDAATKKYVDDTLLAYLTGTQAAAAAALASQVAAAASAAAALISEQAADDWASLAMQWAVNPEDDDVDGYAGQFSALHWAAKAALAQAAAELAQTGAETAQTAAELAETNIGTAIATALADYLPLAGGTMTGAILMSLGNQITFESPDTLSSKGMKLDNNGDLLLDDVNVSFLPTEVVTASRDFTIADVGKHLFVDTALGAVALTDVDLPAGAIIPITVIDATNATTLVAGAGKSINGVATGTATLVAEVASSASYSKQSLTEGFVTGTIDGVA